MENKWILYQTTNLLNNKIYVGAHKLTDTSYSRNYLGSGDTLKKAIKKYGKENFLRITLAEFTCAEDVYLAESNMVTQEFINREDTYNLCLGGKGGTIKIMSKEIRGKISAKTKGRKFSDEHKEKLRAAAKGNKHTFGKKLSNKHKAKIGAIHKGNKYNLGKICSDETKAKISIVHKGKNIKEETKIKMSDSSPTKLAVVIEGKYYKSINFAAKSTNTSRTTITNRVRSSKPKWSQYFFVLED